MESIVFPLGPEKYSRPSFDKVLRFPLRSGIHTPLCRRQWQNGALLADGSVDRLATCFGKMNPAFEFLPVENMVYANQQKYYDTIATAAKAGESSPFIEFMLGNILETLKKYKDISLQNGDAQKYELSTRQKKILAMVSQGGMTIELFAKKLKVSGRTIARDLAQLQECDLIGREGSDKTGRWIVK